MAEAYTTIFITNKVIIFITKMFADTQERRPSLSFSFHLKSVTLKGFINSFKCHSIPICSCPLKIEISGLSIIQAIFFFSMSVME